MRIVVLGATGQLGRAITEELLDTGHEVLGVALEPSSRPDQPRYAGVGLDLSAAGPAELEPHLRGADAVVQAFGADDRERPPAPAARFFERGLVEPSRTVARAVDAAGVPRLVVLGSYFSAMNRLHPQWRMAQRHPYVAAREEQAREVVELAPRAAVNIVEVPFVFGTVDGAAPTWTSTYLMTIRRTPVAFALPGGTAATTTGMLAAAVRAAATGQVPPGRHPLASANVSHRWIAGLALEELGRRVPVVTLNRPLLTAAMAAEKALLAVTRKESGLEPLALAGLLCEELFVDVERSERTYGLPPVDIEAAVRETMRAVRAAG